MEEESREREVGRARKSKDSPFPPPKALLVTTHALMSGNGTVLDDEIRTRMSDN